MSFQDVCLGCFCLFFSDGGVVAWVILSCRIRVLVFILFRIDSDYDKVALLARGPLLLEDGVDIIHFAQLLKERDKVQQLRVGHVIKPRGHRHLSDKHRGVRATNTEG